MRERVSRFIKSQLFLNIIMSLMLLVFVLFLVFVTLDRFELASYWLSTSWDWLSDGESGSTTIRNLGLVLAGLIALPLAIWRSIVAQRQAETAQHSLLNERYQKGAEMLGSQVLEVRLGGIYALQSLAAGHPKEYHIRIMRLLSTFVRNPNRDKLETSGVMSMVNDRSEQQLALERDAEFYLDLRGANLKLLHVSADLSGATLWRVDISLASIHGSQLSGAMLANADLSGTVLSHSDLSGTVFHNTKLSGTDFTGGSLPDARPVAGLTQAQLDQACADPDSPPKLDGVLDAETGEPLVWRGKPC